MIETQTTIDVHTSSVEEQMERFPGEGKPSGYYEVDEEELMKYEPDVDEHECPICCECGCRGISQRVTAGSLGECGSEALESIRVSRA